MGTINVDMSSYRVEESCSHTWCYKGIGYLSASFSFNDGTKFLGVHIWVCSSCYEVRMKDRWT